MPSAIRVVQYGCGFIGCSIVRCALNKPYIELVGAIDLVNIHRDLGEVVGVNKELGVLISKDAEKVLRQTKPDIMLHSTSSYLHEIFSQLEIIIKAGINVISTNEELCYPYKNNRLLAGKIDSLAREYHVTVLGTGVNPGFLMDTWPLFMTGVCQHVEQIKVVRVQDASQRRIQFQEKIGAGKSIGEFKKLVAQGALKHVGLTESVRMISESLMWDLDNIIETIEPIVARREVKSRFITVKPGQSAGVRQIGCGSKNGKEKITLDFQAYIGAEEPHDTVYISGTPNMEVIIKGGTHGDLATAAIVVNSIHGVINAPPGLITMKDLPIVCASSGIIVK